MSSPRSSRHRFKEHEFGSVAFLCDVLLLTLFAYLGRISHDLPISAAGIFETGWPFLIGLIISRVFPKVNSYPFRLYPTGVIVFLSTFGVGMLVRTIYTQTFSLPFTLVACGMLALLLLGYRGLYTLVKWSRSRKRH